MLGEGIALTATHIALLRTVEQTGSLSRAAAACAIPYRTARYQLSRIERIGGLRLLAARSGGVPGGGSTLTAEAHELLARWEIFSGDFDDWLRTRFALAFGQTGGQ